MYDQYMFTTLGIGEPVRARLPCKYMTNGYFSSLLSSSSSSSFFLVCLSSSFLQSISLFVFTPGASLKHALVSGGGLSPPSWQVILKKFSFIILYTNASVDLNCDLQFQELE